MIRVACEQGSDEWRMARLGIPTASQFGKIITPKTLKMSEQSHPYAHKLLAEQILGRPQDDESFGFARRGQEMETAARGYYEFIRDVTVERIGFIMSDDRKVGASPDGFVNADGLLEIKCPSAPVHVGYLLDDAGIGYRAQVQGQLWIAERDWVDTVSYHPELPDVIRRQGRDDIFIRALATAIDAFLEYMEKARNQLARDGYIELVDGQILRMEGAA